MRLVRRLYDWVLHWAETPYGGPALFLLALVESSIFPVPPDVLLIALCIALPSRAWRFALLASAGSVLGGLIGYGIGWGAWSFVEPNIERCLERLGAKNTRPRYIGRAASAST